MSININLSFKILGMFYKSFKQINQKKQSDNS